MIFVVVNELVIFSVGLSFSNIMLLSFVFEIEFLLFLNDVFIVIVLVSEDIVLKIIFLFNIYMMSKIFFKMLV